MLFNFSFYTAIIALSLFIPANAYMDIYSREVDGLFSAGQQFAHQHHRRMDIVSGLSTRELVEELELRLLRRDTTPPPSPSKDKAPHLPATVTEEMKKKLKAFMARGVGFDPDSAPPISHMKAFVVTVSKHKRPGSPGGGLQKKASEKSLKDAKGVAGSHVAGKP